MPTPLDLIHHDTPLLQSMYEFIFQSDILGSCLEYYCISYWSEKRIIQCICERTHGLLLYKQTHVNISDFLNWYQLKLVSNLPMFSINKVKIYSVFFQKYLFYVQFRKQCSETIEMRHRLQCNNIYMRISQTGPEKYQHRQNLTFSFSCIFHKRNWEYLDLWLPKNRMFLTSIIAEIQFSLNQNGFNCTF